ncbi:hypothetical protein ABZZ17_02290 [Streptomyces sp. NPDC006512]|uniref:hypothetical protein n=1 Tax=Streptomyces sp. NPDC006512 TaxID=3154307 RepID=UPI0033AE21E9
MHEVFRYRFLHAGAGLAADLSAGAYGTDTVPRSPGLQIHRGLRLRLPADRALHWKDAAWLAFGASLHAERLAADGVLVLDVDALTYPHAHFRSEAAALALDGWIHRRFGLPACGASVSYDGPSRRFAFTWPDGVTPFADAPLPPLPPE